MSPATYKKVTELTEKQEASIIEKTLESGASMASVEAALNAKGGSNVDKMADKIQPMNQPTSPGPEFIDLNSYGGAWDAGDLDE